MKSHYLVSLVVVVVLGAGCYPEGARAPDNRGNLSFSVSALTDSDIVDACYRLTVVDGDARTLYSEELCGSDLGFGPDLLYLGACDADAPDHTITLELLAIFDADGEIPPDSYANPCPPGAGCVAYATCEANADVPVHFEFTVLVNAGWGFQDFSFDVDVLRCSAKLDCVDDEGVELELLPEPPDVRGGTVVLGIVCEPADCEEPGAWMYVDDIVITCDQGQAVITPAGLGPALVTQSWNLVWQAVVYDNGHALGSHYGLRLAIGFNHGTNCRIRTSATASEEPFTDLTIPDGQLYPAVSWDLPLTGPDWELLCSQHPLDGEPAGVSTFFPTAPEDRSFDNELMFDLDCDSTGTTW